MRQTDLIVAARKLADAVEFDMNGTTGKGGNGGLLSDTTLRAAHEVQALLNQPSPTAPPEPMGMLCTGCGSSWDSERLTEEKAKRPELLSCCPERKMVPVYDSPAVYVLKRIFGMYGASYDTPDILRAYTFEHQPMNVVAYRLGLAVQHMRDDRPGDAIDAGLNLLRHLEYKGFGVFSLDPKENTDPEKEPVEGGSS